jgi:hypothetical protein
VSREERAIWPEAHRVGDAGVIGVNGEGRPRNLRRGYFTRKSGIPSLVVKALKRTLFFNSRLVELAR